MGNVVEFLAGDLFELLSLGGEFFVNFDDLFGHDCVSILRTAQESEVRAGGEAFMAVIIQPEAKDERLLLFG